MRNISNRSEKVSLIMKTVFLPLYCSVGESPFTVHLATVRAAACATLACLVFSTLRLRSSLLAVNLFGELLFSLLTQIPF